MIKIFDRKSCLCPLVVNKLEVGTAFHHSVWRTVRIFGFLIFKMNISP